MSKHLGSYTGNLASIALIAISTGCLNYPRNGQSLPTKSSPVEFQGYGGNGVTLTPQIYNTATATWDPIPLDAPLVTGGTPHVDSINVSWYAFDNPNVTLPTASKYWVASPNNARTISTKVRVKDPFNNFLTTYDTGFEGNCPYTAGYDIINNCKSAQTPNVTLTVPCGAAAATCCLSGPACDSGSPCTDGSCGLGPNNSTTFTYNKTGTDNPILFRVLSGSFQYSNQAYAAQNTLVSIQLPGGIWLPLPVQSIVLKSPTQNPAQVTEVNGTLSIMPDLGAVAWPGPLSGMATNAAGGPTNFSIVSGSDFNSRNLELQVAPTRNFINLQPISTIDLPVIGFANTLLKPAKDAIDNQVNILLDTSDPGFYAYGGLIGQSFAGLDAAGIGISTHSTIPWAPTTTSDLPPGTIPNSINGAVFLSGTTTLSKGIELTGTAVLDIGESLANPSLPVRLGVNAKASIGLPIVSDFSGIQLTLANATYYQQWDAPLSAWAAFDGIAGGNQLELTGPGFNYNVGKYFPSAAEMRVFGQLKFNNGVLDTNYSSASLRASAASVGGVAVSNLSFDISKANGVQAAASLQTKLMTFQLKGKLTPNSAVLTGTAEFSTHIKLTANDLAIDATSIDSGVCKAQQAVAGTICGVHMIQDAVHCGTDIFNDAAHCGYTYAANLAKCGETTVTSAAQCGTSYVSSIAKCGWSFIGSFPNFNKAAKSCNIPNTCKVTATCSFPSTCEIARSCNTPVECNKDQLNNCAWHYSVPPGGVDAMVSGSLTATVGVKDGVNRVSYAVGAGATVKSCFTPLFGQPVCKSISATIDKSGPLPRICVPNLPSYGLGDAATLKQLYCFDL